MISKNQNTGNTRVRIQTLASQIMVLQLTDFTSEITDEELREFTSEYYIPFALHPVVPAASASIADFPEGKVGVYTRFFEFANQRVPLSLFMCNVLNHYRLHISQLHCIGAAKITNFEVNCRLLAIHPTVHLFRAFYHTSWSNGWVSFSKRAGRLQCYTEKLDALRRWREMFFWVDDALVPWDFAILISRGHSPRDETVPPPGRIVWRMRDYKMRTVSLIKAYSEGLSIETWALVVIFTKPEEMVRKPLLESTAGRTMELVLEQPEVESTDCFSTYTAARGKVGLGLNAKGATSDDGRNVKEGLRYVNLGLGPKAFEGMPLVDQLMEELIMVLRSMRAEVEGAVGKAGGEVRNFSNEYDEELYTLHVCPLLLSEGRHKTMGCACAMALWNIKEVKQVLWDVVMCALARGKWKGGRKLLEKIVADSGLPPRAASDCPQLVRDQDYPIDVIMAGLTLARHATEGAEAQPDYFLKPDVAHTAGFLSFAMSACHLKSFLIEKGLRLKESDHPRSDGVPVSVATVSPKDSELLGKLEEAEDVAYQVGSSEQSRCHSI
ncbi:hypothetical protein Tco_0163434 [Tanacetum coccineum]